MLPRPYPAIRFFEDGEASRPCSIQTSNRNEYRLQRTYQLSSRVGGIAERGNGNEGRHGLFGFGCRIDEQAGRKVRQKGQGEDESHAEEQHGGVPDWHGRSGREGGVVADH